MCEARIKYIESRLGLYKVIDLDKLSRNRVVFGSTCVLVDEDTDEEKTYTVLGPDDSNPSKGSISYLSPVGTALLGREVGDEVTINIPRGSVTYEITEIKFLGHKVVE